MWVFRKLALGAVVTLTGAYASAADLPPDLQKQFKPFQVVKAESTGTVVRLTMNRPVVHKDMYESLVRGYCYPIWDGAKKPWGGQRLTRFEVVNDIGAQGFAFNGGAAECKERGKLPSERVPAYMAEKTWVCVAGNPCRARRPGESIAGE